MQTTNEAPKPLAGVRVLEMGQLIAGPFAGCMLAYFGAEVVKIEPPGTGDPLRNWRVLKDGTSLWWRAMGRNKKCVTLNLREPRGREIARTLALRSDVLIENFRPGTMEKWGLGPEDLRAEAPELVYARVSGYGQTGPFATKPGFASVCEGFGGFRYINGFPGEAPVRPNLSLGDTLAALHAVIGVLLALVHRNRIDGRSIGGSGQVVDIAIYESVYNVLEAMVPEYDGAGIVREPSGSTLTGIVPTNTLSVRGRPVRDHRRERGLDLQAADARGGTGRFRRRPAARRQRGKGSRTSARWTTRSPSGPAPSTPIGCSRSSTVPASPPAPSTASRTWSTTRSTTPGGCSRRSTSRANP